MTLSVIDLNTIFTVSTYYYVKNRLILFLSVICRYFLSGILQMEIFKNMCDISLDVNPNAKGQKLTVPLHRCDIYGSKKSGKHLM